MDLRVVLVEDVEELRGTLRQALRLRGGFDVVADAGDGSAGVAAAAQHQPDLVVLDLGLPDLAGAELVARVREAAPSARIVVYTGSASAEGSGVVSHVDAFVRKERDLSYLVELLADLGRTDHPSADVELGPGLDDVATARRFLARQCVQWGCTSAVEDAQLVVTELVTNALVHAGTTCRLSARFSGGVLRLEVQDGGEGAPDLQAATTEDEHGRGVLLVSVLAESWGVERFTGGKVVWAEFVVRGDLASRNSPSATTEDVGSGGPDRSDERSVRTEAAGPQEAGDAFDQRRLPAVATGREHDPAGAHRIAAH